MDFQEIPVLDAWMQHPTEEFLTQEMFATLRRWQVDDAFSELTRRHLRRPRTRCDASAPDRFTDEVLAFVREVN